MEFTDVTAGAVNEGFTPAGMFVLTGYNMWAHLLTAFYSSFLIPHSSFLILPPLPLLAEI